MKWLISFMIAFPLFFSSAQAQLVAFEQRFEFVRSESGQVVMVLDRSIQGRFSLAPYLDQIRNMILSEQALMLEKNYGTEIDDLFAPEMLEIQDPNNPEKSVQHVLNTWLVRDSLGQVERMDIDGIFADRGFNEVIKAYEEKLSLSLDQLNPRVLARLDNAQFFYPKAVGYQIINWGLDFAKRRLSSVPLLNTASFVLVEMERMMRERRIFHQNMLMHYLERHSAQELGLSEDEVAQIYSSVYESRIPWFNIWDSRAAQANWMDFGYDRFYQGFRAASTRLRNYSGAYTALGERHNFAFQEAIVDGERVILNLFDNEGMFKNRPAIAYNYDQPHQVQRRRIVLMLADLGLSFVPIPQFIKDFGSNYFKSHYEQQRLTEGALYAFFEQGGDTSMQTEVLSQYFNPFDLAIQLP